MSGDVRRALELCRKAAEIAEEQQHASAAPASSPGETLSMLGFSTGFMCVCGSMRGPLQCGQLASSRPLQ